MSLTDRDKKLVMILVPVVLLLGYWFLILGPQRSEVSSLDEKQVAAESARDESVATQQRLSASRNQYASDYETVVRLGKAIPSTLDMPSLLVQLETAAKGTGIDFDSITVGERTAAAAATAGSSSSAGSAPVESGGQKAGSAPGSATEQANEGADKADQASQSSGATTSGTGSSSSGSSTTSAVPGLDTVAADLQVRGQLLRPGRLLPPRQAVRAGGQRRHQGQGPAHDHRRDVAEDLGGVPQDHRRADVDRLPLAQERGRERRRHAAGAGGDAGRQHQRLVQLEHRSGPGLRLGRRGPVSPLALGIYEDLRRRRLLPVAVLLLVCAVALPVFALKPAEEPAPAPAASTSAAAQSVDGLPSPEAALSDKPLVSLAVLDEPSDLGEFESKDPFKPIEKVSADGASDSESGSSSGGGSSGGSGTAAAPLGDSGSGGSRRLGGGSGGGSGQTGTPAPQTAPKQDGGSTPAPAPKTEKKLTYALDLTIRGPKGLRAYRGLPKLSLLPAQDNPLLVFLGVEDAGTKAVFLVDAKLRSEEGEGTCTPSPEQCATLALAPGEEHVLVNDQGQSWTIRIVEVRETSVAKAAAAARKAQKRRARQATRSVAQPAPRFVPPIITDLFTGGRS